MSSPVAPRLGSVAPPVARAGVCILFPKTRADHLRVALPKKENPRLDYERLAFGHKFHGHRCPSMPRGLRTGLAAMKALGVGHTPDEMLLDIRAVQPYACRDAPRPFEWVVCSECGDMAAERNARLKAGKPFCKPSAGCDT